MRVRYPFPPPPPPLSQADLWRLWLLDVLAWGLLAVCTLATLLLLAEVGSLLTPPAARIARAVCRLLGRSSGWVDEWEEVAERVSESVQWWLWGWLEILGALWRYRRRDEHD